MENPYTDRALVQAKKLKKVIDKIAVWEANKKKALDSTDYAADRIKSFMNEDDYPVQIDLQKQIDELIYSLTSLKINYDEDEWVPEDDIEQMTMMRLKESLWNESRFPKSYRLGILGQGIPPESLSHPSASDNQ